MTDATWTPTRAEALRRLDDFLPHAGRDYADRRNYDLGPGDRSNVSALSPYVRHRLITEEEIVSAAMERHGPYKAEKFIQEVSWRTYWRGWLELRPGVWSEYRDGVAGLIRQMEDDAGLRERVAAATGGGTGIGCFDAWADELVATNYLHNHTRMWFASIWIFTLELPWELGADFFLRHLHCGCPASNTLSWRWVAGLQTKGKTYLATADNIARYTEGRFKPREKLAAHARPIEGYAIPAAGRLAQPGRVGEGAFGLLLTEEDLAPEVFDELDRSHDQVRAVAGLVATADRSPSPTSEAVQAFASGAVDDALARASTRFDAPTSRLGDDWLGDILSWASEHELDQLVTPEAPVGPARDRLDAIEPGLNAAGIRLDRVRRAWDAELWPLATAGYFPFKEKFKKRHH